MRSFKSDQVNLFYGKAMLIVRAGEEKGIIQIKASSNGLQADNVSINVN